MTEEEQKEAELAFKKQREQEEKVQIAKIEASQQLFTTLLGLSKQGLDVFQELRKSWDALKVDVDNYIWRQDSIRGSGHR